MNALIHVCEEATTWPDVGVAALAIALVGFLFYGVYRITLGAFDD